MLTKSHRQEALSRAYIRAIVGHCGFSCAYRDFDYGIDVTIREVTERAGRLVESGRGIDIQAKSSTTALIEDEFIDSIHDLLVFAACAELDPRRFFPRALKKAVHYANRCLLAGVPTGSFVVEVESPLDRPASQTQVVLGSVPWERRVLARLMGGLGDIHKAVDSGDTEALVEPHAWRLNSNVCDALLGMKPDTSDVTLEISAAWSHSWPSADERIPRRVVFDSRAFETVGSLGKALSRRCPVPAGRRGSLGRTSRRCLRHPRPRWPEGNAVGDFQLSHRGIGATDHKSCPQYERL